MEYKLHLGYKVYENGNLENNKGVILKPLIKNGYSYYEIKNNIFGDIAFIKAAKQDRIIEEYKNHVKYTREIKEKSNASNIFFSSKRWKSDLYQLCTMTSKEIVLDFKARDC